MAHPFGEQLAIYRSRRPGLSQARLAQILGYDPAVITRMAQGRLDLTGPTGRDRVVRIIGALRDEGALHTLDEANALLAAAAMPPLYDGLPAESTLVQAFSSDPNAFSPDPTHAHTAHNLPALLSSFIGREEEIAELSARLRGTRLLTLTGAGGVGKSRLADRLAREVLTDFPDGVWLVQLAPVGDGALVVNAVASALGLRPSGRAVRDMLVDHLRDKHLLLVFDNCEHLIESCAAIAEAVLHACPRLSVVATSREPLRVAGEVAWRVPPLPDEFALRLFEVRARAVRRNFVLREGDAALVAKICARLDGIPLAIELAAARLTALTLEQIAARLDDRFRLLTVNSRTALPRHRTLRAAIDWSYGLLTEAERALLHQVSVFAGGWTLELAELTCGIDGTLDALAQLVDRSLVMVRDTPLGARYDLHETIRQYAREQLIESGGWHAAQRHHAEACLALAKRAQAQWQFTDQRRWIASLEADLDNIRAALAWSLSDEGDPGLGVQIAAGLNGFWLQSRRLEGREWMQQLHRRMPQTLPLDIRGPALLEYAYLLDTTRPPELRELQRQLRELYAREDPESPIVVEILGYQAMVADTYEASAALMAEAEAIAQRSPHRHARYWLPYFRGLHLGPARWKLDMARAQASYHDLLAAATERGDSFGQALAYEGMMHVAFYELRLQQAVALAEHALVLAEPIGAEMVILSTLHCMAEVALYDGRLTDAEAFIETAHMHNARYGHLAPAAHVIGLRMQLALQRGEHAAVRRSLEDLRPYACAITWVTVPNAAAYLGAEALACLASAEGRSGHAARLFGAVQAERERQHEAWWPKDRARITPYVEAARADIGAAAFEQAWAEGRAMTMAEATTFMADAASDVSRRTSIASPLPH